MARLLFVTSRLPYPPREGHQLRSWHLLRAATREHEVHLLALQRPQEASDPDPVLRAQVASVTCVPMPLPSHPATLARMLGATLRGAPLLDARYVGSELRTRFRQAVRRADLVHLDILAVAGLAQDMPTALPLILNEHNVEHALLRSRAEIESTRWRSMLYHWQSDRLQRFERQACEAATRVLACSDVDATRLRALAPYTPVDVIPNGVDLAQFTPGSPHEEDPLGLVFVGQMGWFPNRDGIADFMASTLPLIRRRCAARLQVIGHDGGMRAPAGLESAVEFTGFVDDLRERVLRAAVYVVPLRAGSGTRLKLLEAMAMGKAIVSTRIGAEGIGLRDGEDALLADTPEEFARAVVRLLHDPGLRARLGRAARAAAERDFGWEAIGTRLLRSYSNALESTAPASAAPVRVARHA